MVYCGQPWSVCSELFPPFHGIEVILMPRWWLESPQFVLATGGSCFLRKAPGPLHTALKVRPPLKVEARPFLPGQRSRCTQICSSAKRCDDLKPGLVSFPLSVSFLLPLNMKQDSGQAGTILGTSVAFHQVLAEDNTFEKGTEFLLTGGKEKPSAERSVGMFAHTQPSLFVPSVRMGLKKGCFPSFLLMKLPGVGVGGGKSSQMGA